MAQKIQKTNVCRLHEKIYVSAGQLGMQLRLTPQDLIEYVPLKVIDLI